jgi:hypothetical protein
MVDEHNVSLELLVGNSLNQAWTYVETAIR